MIVVAVAAATPWLYAQTQNKKAPQSPTATVGTARPERLPATPERIRQLKVPDGFSVSIFAQDLGKPRMMVVLDDGAVLVSRPHTNDVVLLRDKNGDGRADEVKTVVTGLDRVHGVARAGKTLYLATPKKLFSATLRGDGGLEPARPIVQDLPDGGQHAKRTVGVGRDGMLYVSIGSDCNDCVESNPEHATILRMKPDGSGRAVFARGLRNTMGFDWNPKTGELWGADIGTDWRGDELPPDELNLLVEGGHYGWPFCWGEREVDRTRDDPPGTKLDKFCAESKPSQFAFPAHASPISLLFYTGAQFPSDYQGDAFVTLHGSWNRAAGGRPPKVERIRFDGGKPVRSEDFLSGFLIENGKAWFGRPAGLAITREGALLVSDDDNGIVYRVAYRAKRAGEGTPPAAPAVAAPPPAAAAVEGSALRRLAHIEGLSTPESVLHDEQQDIYLVSNINGNSGAKDGNGFISFLSPEGEIKSLKFIESGRNGAVLNAPKGMALDGDALWVADIDALRSFNRKTGASLATVDLSTQKARFLNDVVMGPGGALFVTDTGLQFDGEGNRSHPGPDQIFRVGRDGKATVAIAGPFLEGPNGIAWDAERRRFLVVQNTGKDVLSWSGTSGKPKRVVSGVGLFDGVIALGGDAFLVSSHHDNAIYFNGKGALAPLLPSPPTPGDIGYDRKRNRLLIPSLKGNWVEIWQLPPQAKK